MAILKHRAIKKQDYGDIQRYLIFRCEEGTHTPLRDEHGSMIPRDHYIMDGLNCNPFTFDTECMELNRYFRKNCEKGEIMAHHYIISFDPRDAEDHGLTPERAHALSLEFANHFFVGHQALVVTHSDGNNHSGNIHTHIVINSLRKAQVVWKPFMERKCDSFAGYKHHLTDALLHRMHEYLYDLCEREHLYTVDISRPTDRNVTDREYHAQRRGEREQERIRQEQGKGTSSTLQPGNAESGRLSFDTVKQQIRDAADAAAAKAKTELEFINILSKEYGIRVRLKRGRYSYEYPDREKPMTARSLGNAYQREVILEKIQLNKMPVPEETASRPEFADLPRIFLVPSNLRLVVDLQHCVKAQQSRAYARKVTVSNIQRIADTVSWLQKNNLESLDKLSEVKGEVDSQYYTIADEYYAAERDLRLINQQIKHLGRFYANRKVYAQYEEAENALQFRLEHREAIQAYAESELHLRDLFPDGKFPSLVDLREKKAELVKRRDKLKAEYKAQAGEKRHMDVVWKNVCYILGRSEELARDDGRQRGVESESRERMQPPVREQPERPRENQIRPQRRRRSEPSL